MGGLDLSLPGAPFLRARPASGSGSGPSATALSGAVAGAAVAGLTLSVVAEQAETTALVARMSVTPTATRRGQIDALIAGLKSDGVWGKLDWLLLLAAHSAQSGRLNWRATKELSAVNSPAFTADRGYAGDGATAYLDFGERPENVGPQSIVTQSTTVGVWMNVGPTIGFQAGSSDGATLFDIKAAGFRLRVTTGQFSTSYAAGTTGNFAGTETGGTTQTPYKNGVAGTASAFGGYETSAGNLTLLRQGASYSDGRMAAAYTGAGLTAAAMAALHSRINTYLTAIGGA